MLSKELFIKRMSLIQNYHSEKETLGVLIEKLTDGHCIVTMGDYLIDELVDTINEALNIEDEDFLFWWLYEDVDKVIYVEEDKISVRTLEELYDYIITEWE